MVDRSSTMKDRIISKHGMPIPAALLIIAPNDWKVCFSLKMFHYIEQAPAYSENPGIVVFPFSFEIQAFSKALVVIPKTPRYLHVEVVSPVL